MNSIEERITKVLRENFKIAEEIGPTTTFGDLSIDSLVIVELALILDAEFGTALEDGELTTSMTVADAAGLLVARGATP